MSSAAGCLFNVGRWGSGGGGGGGVILQTRFVFCSFKLFQYKTKIGFCCKVSIQKAPVHAILKPRLLHQQEQSMLFKTNISGISM